MEFSNNNPNNLTLAEIREEAYKQGREDAIAEAISKICIYGSVWMSYTDGMTREQIAQEALNAAKDTIVDILEQMKGANG